MDGVAPPYGLDFGLSGVMSGPCFAPGWGCPMPGPTQHAAAEAAVDLSSERDVGEFPGSRHMGGLQGVAAAAAPVAPGRLCSDVVPNQRQAGGGACGAGPNGRPLAAGSSRKGRGKGRGGRGSGAGYNGSNNGCANGAWVTQSSGGGTYPHSLADTTHDNTGVRRSVLGVGAGLSTSWSQPWEYTGRASHESFAMSSLATVDDLQQRPIPVRVLGAALENHRDEIGLAHVGGRSGYANTPWKVQETLPWEHQGPTPSYPSRNGLGAHLLGRAQMDSHSLISMSRRGPQSVHLPDRELQDRAGGSGEVLEGSRASQSSVPPPGLAASSLLTPSPFASGPPPTSRFPWSSARWHKSAESVGLLTEEDHIFTKIAGPRLKRMHDSGAGHYELATICMVFDATLRCGGSHMYRFCFMDGELGPADGAGFVFDTKVRRRPLGQMRAVFMNQRGFICLRKGSDVSKSPVRLPRLGLGMYLSLNMDLDRCSARFEISDAEGHSKGSADVGLEALFDDCLGSDQLRSGFFCAVVTGNITVGLY
mmetsp:Transcript_51881/g.136330  ORF Transcript_51881/g.136330 Transcript_51881/m.136330 type:complete len:535 (-) Transcript_51881:195-1799(-)